MIQVVFWMFWSTSRGVDYCLKRIMTSRDWALDTRSSVRDVSAGHTERVVWVAGQGDVSWRIYLNDGDCSTAVLGWAYRDYVVLCADWFYQIWITEMAQNENNPVVHDRQGRVWDTATSAFAQCWQQLSRICAGLMIGYESLDRPCIRHQDEIEYALRLQVGFGMGLTMEKRW